MRLKRLEGIFLLDSWQEENIVVVTSQLIAYHIYISDTIASL
jgi:hypothetical protein